MPVSVSIATNVPGFEKEYFYLSTNPDTIAGVMFDYFSQIAEKATALMTDKMKPLKEAIENHYNKMEKKKWLLQVENTVQTFPSLDLTLVSTI